MVILTFNSGYPNESLQIGDILYYVNNPNTNYANTGYITGDDLNDSGINLPNTETNPVSTLILIGTVSSIQMTTESIDGGFKIYAEEPSSGIVQPEANVDFIMFVKDSAVETSSVKGYYNKIVMKNNSKKKAELFSLSSEVSESSK